MDKFEAVIKNKEKGTETAVPIVAFTPKTGRGQGMMKLVPEKFEQWSIQKFIDLWGEKLITKLLMQAFKPKLAVFTKEATTKPRLDAEGKPVLDAKKKPVKDIETDPNIIQKTFADLLAVLSKRGETIQYLKRRLTEIDQEQLQILAVLMPEDGEPPSIEEMKTLREQLNDLREERKEVEQAIEEKKADDDDEDDEQEAKKPESNVAVAA